VISTTAGRVYVVINKRDADLQGKLFQYKTGSGMPTTDWVGRMIGRPFVPFWQDSMCAWEYKGDDVDHADLLSTIENMAEFSMYSTFTEMGPVPELCLHNRDTLQGFFREYCVQNGISTSELAEGEHEEYVLKTCGECDVNKLVCDLFDLAPKGNKRRADANDSPMKRAAAKRHKHNDGGGAGADSAVAEGML
jgi:hypothetical protein